MTLIPQKERLHHFLFSEPDYSTMDPYLQYGKEPGAVLLYLKGTNGSGKSTIPSAMAKADPDAYYWVLNKRKLLTVFPGFHTVAVGKYDDSNSKGCDALKDTEEMILALKHAAQYFPTMDLIFEGIIPATIEGPWIPRLQAYKGSERELVVGYITTPYEVCLQRIQSRNAPGKAFNEELVRGKYDGMVKSRDRHNEVFPDVRMVRIDTMKPVEEMVIDFLERRWAVVNEGRP